MGKHSAGNFLKKRKNRVILATALCVILIGGLFLIRNAGRRAYYERQSALSGGEGHSPHDQWGDSLPGDSDPGDSSGSGDTQTSSDTEEEEDIVSLIGDTDYLTVSGSSIVKADGSEVVLKGTNLGGWLIQECWMCPVTGTSSTTSVWTQRDTILTLEERFGSEQAQALLEEYQDNWITDEDIRTLSEQGCNCLRVPFWYGNFMSVDTYDWLSEDPDQNPGFQRLDWIIQEAGRYGMYVILDLHGTPGGQSTDQCAGNSGNCLLYSDSSYVDRMEELWLAISDRYKDDPVVAAYDIMNEPQIPEEISSAEGTQSRNDIYSRMITAIRENGDNHILAVEGIWTLDVLPLPEESGWTNVIYEVHLYGVNDPEKTAAGYRTYSDQHQIPVFTGECMDVELEKALLEQKVSCTSWTYKGAVPAEDGWYMYYSQNCPSADVTRDSYETIAQKWGERLNTQYFTQQNITAELSSCWKEGTTD